MKRKGLVTILILIVGYAISWAITVGIIKLITMCFSFDFYLAVATVIWLILCLLKLAFPKSEGRR